MSDIMLSSAVRANLASLRQTADLLSAAQTRLATGKKVNSAFDNPTNFFTAAAFDSRASDLNNVLDGITSGFKTLDATNTSITALTDLITSAQSTARSACRRHAAARALRSGLAHLVAG